VTPAVPPDYPSGWEFDAVLADGGAAHVRPIRPGDAAAHSAFFGHQSRESVHSRFFSTKAAISAAEVTHFTTVDYHDRMAFVAFLGEEMIAVGRYERLASGTEAEVAFAVADDQQRRGLATLVLKYLASYAHGHGISRLSADTLTENRPMLEVFRAAGFRREGQSTEFGVVHLACDINTAGETRPSVQQK
jgi:RimJ/RimL family protein N-acetyltransferase